MYTYIYVYVYIYINYIKLYNIYIYKCIYIYIKLFLQPWAPLHPADPPLGVVPESRDPVASAGNCWEGQAKSGSWVWIKQGKCDQIISDLYIS